MIVTSLTQTALEICKKAHQGQVDKAGLPYEDHPIHLAEQMDTEEETVVALLHDVVEDSSFTFEDLQEYAFSELALEALRLLTHKEGVDYFDYVKSLAPNDLARKIKLADLAHNSDISRIPHPMDNDYRRLEKYRKAREILESYQTHQL